MYATSRSYAAVLSAIFVAVFCTDISGYAYTSGLSSAAPRYAMLALGVLALPVLWEQVRRRKVRLDDKFLCFVLVAAFVSTVGFVIHLDAASARTNASAELANAEDPGEEVVPEPSPSKVKTEEDAKEDSNRAEARAAAREEKRKRKEARATEKREKREAIAAKKLESNEAKAAEKLERKEAKAQMRERMEAKAEVVDGGPMQIAFVAVAAAGLLYFLLAKRRFDFFSVAFFSACAYFLPGFFGYATYPVTGDGVRELVRSYLTAQTYLVFVVVLAAVLVGGIVQDRLTRRGREPTLEFRGGENTAAFAVGLGVIGFVVSFITDGEVLLSDASKTELIQELSRWHILWTTGASLGAVLSFRQRRWGLFSISLVLLLVDLYAGFRSSLAVCLIAVFVLWLSSGGRHRFALKNWKIALGATAVAFFFFLYKQLYMNIRSGRWDLILERVDEAQVYIRSVVNSEPFITQSVLNEVLANRFSVGAEHLQGFWKLILPFSSEFTSQPTSFNTLYQPVLFPDVRAGMANNIWAEMISSGGWPLFALFVVFFVLLLAAGSYLLKARDPILAGGAALFFSYWAFYIHRNDLLYQVTLERRVLGLLVVCTLLAMLTARLDPEHRLREAAKWPFHEVSKRLRSRWHG